MAWINVPAGTQSFFLHMHDLDLAPNNITDDQAHWVFWNIPPIATGLPEGAPRASPLPDGSFQISATGSLYRVPGTAVNDPLHHYIFHLHALDIRLEVKPAPGAFEARAAVCKPSKVTFWQKRCAGARAGQRG
jgi:Raf kinase inhibitor-like YbhB/YbcL family protein